MDKCPACGNYVPKDAGSCPACGAPFHIDLDDTQTVGMSRPPSHSERPTGTLKPSSKPGSGGRTPSKGAIHEGRFPPGTVLVERYRIVALLGSGGMGEVYRADDLTLGQAVALKFLPTEIGTHENAIARLRNEVRIARQVSHPNVCRVYDVGSAEGSMFISMEYVDGEDLESLLRRIGRLPADKGIQIARKVCAGLAAAHEKGILHRDLKPSNVMLDGRGEAVITDFGLAALAEEVQGADVRSGTPAYMAPEQLAGKEVTARSDIYTLGLMFYEIFTGRRPYDEKTLPDLVRAQKLATPANPTTLVSDLDPAVERVILRCLSPDPASRPPSALAVAAALPGGDPLAAALAAGETPSPQLVAAAGLTTGLSPKVAISCFVAIVVSLLGASYLSIRTSALEALHLQNSPEVLESKAREIVRDLGYTTAPADTGQGFSFQSSFLDYVQKNEKAPPDWDRVLASRPSPLRFWYRESPEPMIPVEFHDDALTPALMQENDPPATLSGMINLQLDAGGRLIRFQAIPPQFEPSAKPAPAANWSALFSAAGLDPSQFQATDPEWLSLAAFDTRAAWKGIWPGTHYPLHIEAAAWRGKPVFFLLTGPWDVPDRMPSKQERTPQKASAILLLVLALSILTGAVLLARFNLVRGRGDRAGALRLAFAIFCVQMLLWICRAHFAPSLGNFLVFLLAISTSLFAAGVLFILYLALEPYVRRHWPQTIISWSRLLTGRVRDPLVGADVVFGLILAMIWILLFQGHDLAMQTLGSHPNPPSTDSLLGIRGTFGVLLYNVTNSARSTLILFFLLFLLRTLLRNPWLAGAVFVVLASAPQVIGSQHFWLDCSTQLLIYISAAIVVLRFGLVSLAVGIFTTNVFLTAPITFDLSVWYFSSSTLVIVAILVLAVWAVRTSLGGRRVLKADWLE